MHKRRSATYGLHGFPRILWYPCGVIIWSFFAGIQYRAQRLTIALFCTFNDAIMLAPKSRPSSRQQYHPHRSFGAVFLQAGSIFLTMPSWSSGLSSRDSIRANMFSLEDALAYSGAKIVRIQHCLLLMAVTRRMPQDVVGWHTACIRLSMCYQCTFDTLGQIRTSCAPRCDTLVCIPALIAIFEKL